MADPAAACVFVPAHEPWSCATHPGGYRVSLNETVCRAAQAETIQPMTAADLDEFDRWAESRRGRGVSLGMLWALRLRATLDAANVRVAAPPSEDAAPLDVARLVRAMSAAGIHVDAPRPGPTRDVACGSCRKGIEAIAREYVALAEPKP